MDQPIWFRAYAPRTVLDAAKTLADHVDFWEEDRLQCVWHTRALSSFLGASSSADIRQAPRFRELLHDYVDLGVESARSQPSDDSFQRERKRAVREAIVEVKRWLGEPREQALGGAGAKRERDEGGDWV